MFTVVSEHIFPFLRELGGDDSTYSHHMKNARLTFPTAALLVEVVDLIAAVPMVGQWSRPPNNQGLTVDRDRSRHPW